MIAMVDEEEKINTMITALETMVSGGCMIAISDVTVVKYLEHGDEKNTTTANASVNRK
jgi:PII-like signaling protein